MPYLLFCITHGIVASCSYMLTGPDSLYSSEAPSVLRTPPGLGALLHSAAHQFICLYCMLLMDSFYDEQFPVHSDLSSLNTAFLWVCTYLELAAPMFKAFYPEYLLFVNKVELSLITEMLIKDWVYWM